MAINRAQARHRVRTITAWVAGGATALTSAFALGAAKGDHAAATTAKATAQAPTTRQEGEHEDDSSLLGAIAGALGSPGAPPTSSNQAPQAMSGGS